jgi:hypothetical protein
MSGWRDFISRWGWRGCVVGFAVELQTHSCLVAKLLAQSQQM